jgi:hypothetical protein
VEKVEVFEHENNSAIYSKEDISFKIYPSTTSTTSSPIITNRSGV